MEVIKSDKRRVGLTVAVGGAFENFLTWEISSTMHHSPVLTYQTRQNEFCVCFKRQNSMAGLLNLSRIDVEN